MYYNGEPRDNDVLAGRGNGANQHPGNVFFRALVAQQRDAYNKASSSNQKKSITSNIVAHVLKRRVPAGRFLQKVPRARNTWYIMLEKDIMKKTAQALRDHPKNDGSIDNNSTPAQPISVSIKAVAPRPINYPINGTKPPEKYNPEFENSLNWDELVEDNSGSTDITNSVLNALLNSLESIDTDGLAGLVDSAHGQENCTDHDAVGISIKETSLKDMARIHKEDPLIYFQQSCSNGHSQSRSTIISSEEHKGKSENQWHTSSLRCNYSDEGYEQRSTVSTRHQSLPTNFFSGVYEGVNSKRGRSSPTLNQIASPSDDRKGYEECHSSTVSARMTSSVLSSNVNELPQLNYQSQVDIMTKSATRFRSCSNENKHSLGMQNRVQLKEDKDQKYSQQQ